MSNLARCRLESEGKVLQFSVEREREPLILAVETATPLGSVAVARGPVLLASRRCAAQGSHSATLLRAVDEALCEACLKLGDVDLFAAAAGPGSFTGLRIGLATVKAFAATLGRACAGVPTLHAVARAAGPSLRTLALVRAGRGEVFGQVLRVDDAGQVQELSRAAHLPPARLMELVGEDRAPLVLAGDAATECAARLGGLVPGLDITVRGASTGSGGAEGPNLAAHTAALALAQYKAGAAVRPEALQAIYVRPSDAELKERWPPSSLSIK